MSGDDLTKPCINCPAITGSLLTKDHNPAVPITISEQIESTQAAFEAGAGIAHCHVRDAAGKPTSDPERFARLMEGLKTHCPGMIIQLSTGRTARVGTGAELDAGFAARYGPAFSRVVQLSDAGLRKPTGSGRLAGG